MMNWVTSTFSDASVQPTKKRKISVEKDSLPEYPREQVNRWKPKKKEDLVIHKKKVEEIQDWLNWIKKGQGSSILLLTGPPGCGKLTTVKVLCSCLGVNLTEWCPQVAQRNYDPENGSYHQSDVSLFEEFVLRATRYSNVLNAVSTRLIVVKDIPNGFVKDSSRFHEFLDRYSSADKVYLAFITTDVSITRELFSESIKSKYSIKTVAFNPVTLKNVKTALERISGGSNHINGISLSCNGDLRNAIETLQFLSVKGQLPQKRNKKGPENVQKTDVVDLFHGLGRVLYAKRDNGRLTHCPVEIGESFTSSPELFSGMLHQNYLNTFSSVHDVAKASQKLSFSNVILSDFKDTITSRSLGLILASYGLMSYNSNPVRKFQQMDKARKITTSWVEFRSQYMDTCDTLMDLVTYGRHIPAFSSSNRALLSKCQRLQ